MFKKQSPRMARPKRARFRQGSLAENADRSWGTQVFKYYGAKLW